MAIYIVAKDGSGNYSTIQQAVDVAIAGDTVQVKAGTYKEKITITRSGSSGNYITFAAYPGQTAIVDGTGLVSQWDGIFTVKGASYIKISGFNILHSGYAGVRINGSGTSSNIIVEKNYFNDIYSSAMYTENAGPGIIYDGNEVTVSHKAAMTTEGEVVDMVNVNGFEIKNNYIHDNVHAESINAKIGSSNGKIHHNNIKPVESAGIYLDAWTGLEQNIEVYSNVVYDGVDARGIAMAVEGGGTLRNIKVYNNIVYNNGQAGIIISHYDVCDPNSLCLSGIIDNIQIINNTTYNNNIRNYEWGGGIVNMPTYATNIVIRNNIASQNKITQISVAGTSNIVQNNLFDGVGSVIGSSYIIGNPQFINLANHDFHLTPGSLAIDTGSSINAPTIDFDGKSRPQGAGIDIGAFEYVSACISVWRCETDINGNKTGYEIDGCGNRRLNTALCSPTLKYKCINGTCVEDPTGTFTEPTCNNSCVPVCPTPVCDYIIKIL